MGIDFKINITKKITLNGKEYGSIEEVPQEQRGLVQGAMNSVGTGHAKITLNGKSYDSVEEMPPDLQRQYGDILKKAAAAAKNTGIAMPAAPQAAPGPLRPEGSLIGRPVVIILALAGLAILAAMIAIRL